MKAVYYLFAFGLIINSAAGQITISRSDMPAMNDTARYSTSISLANFTNTGANHRWDFSAMITIGQGVDTFKSTFSINPLAALLFGLTSYGLPPDNMLAFTLLNLQNTYQFYKTSNSNLEINGIGTTYSGIPLTFPYSTPDKIYQFPLTYGRADTSNYALNLTIPLLGGLKQTGTRINVVDGWGTVITPYDSFQCLRLKSVTNEIDSIKLDSSAAVPANIALGIPISTITYKWLAHGNIIPVLEVRGMEIGGTFVPTSVKFRDHVRPVTPLYTLSVDFNANTRVCTTRDTVKFSPVINPFFALNPIYKYSIYPPTYSFVNGTDSSSSKPHVNFDAPGLYTVSLFASASAITTSTSADTTKINYILVTVPNGLESVNASEIFNLYPMPANDFLNCTFNADSYIGVELLDMSGKQLWSIRLPGKSSARIPVSQLPAGVYILKATTDNGLSKTGKINIVH